MRVCNVYSAIVEIFSTFPLSPLEKVCIFLTAFLCSVSETLLSRLPLVLILIMFQPNINTITIRCPGAYPRGIEEFIYTQNKNVMH